MLSGASAATWTICLKLGSGGITAALGAMVITAVALLVNATVLLVMRTQGQEIVVTRHGFWLLAAAGVAASGIDLFGLLAYERGLRVSSSLIMGATSTALILLVGFAAFREPVTLVRVLAIVLIVGGIVLLQSQGA
jgi:drug/metabolite transporter (DMT)-like permease